MLEVLHLINDIPVEIYFVWIPSHLGIKGNERADRWAQSAIKNREPVEIIDSEISQNYTKIQNYIVEKWQNMWANCSHGHFYKNIEPNVSLQIKFEDKNRKKEVTIGRLRLGKCYTDQYLAMMGIVDSDQCPECCNAV